MKEKNLSHDCGNGELIKRKTSHMTVGMMNSKRGEHVIDRYMTERMIYQ